MVGNPITWARGKGTQNWVEERLDRALISDSWWRLFPHASVHNLVDPISNQSPIILNSDAYNSCFAHMNFKFENCWLKEPDLSDIVRDGNG